MLKSSTKIRKSRDGKIIQEVKEHYLRKEIGCGVKGCEICKNYPNPEIIDTSNEGISNLYPNFHIIIPNTATLIKQIDFFENELITNIIILQTVFSDIQSQNIGIYRRIQALLNIPEKGIYVFNNEFHIDTFISNTNQSEKDWKLALYSRAIDFYSSHLNISVISLDSDISIIDYVNSLSFYDEIIDILNIDESETEISIFNDFKSKNKFFDYISSSYVNLGIKTGKYLSGIFYQNNDDYLSGTILVKDSSFCVSGLCAINRAVTGDLVAFLPMKTENSCVRIDEVDFEIPSDDVRCIVGIVRRNWKQYCGVVFRKLGDCIYLFKPMDDRIPFIFFESKRQNLEGKKICVSIDRWSADFRYPHGHIVKILGDVGDLKCESESILFERRVPYSKFSKAVLGCLPDLEGRVDKPEWRVDKVLINQPDRKDLRYLNICSIDPPGCTDIDDALHIRFISSDKQKEIYEIGVHIADVTHFVLPGTPIDKEAYRRGTTVYLVDRRVDMLPELLSSNLCSLRPNEDRLAFSMLCKIDNYGNLCEPPIFTKSAIRSKRAFTYAEAQCLIDDKSNNTEMAQMLRKLLHITKQMRDKRYKNGALSFDSPELQSELDSETNDPIGFKVKESLETNKLVEECMLLANILVAKKIYESFPKIAILRSHPVPETDKLEELYGLINRTFNLKESLGTRSLSEMLDCAKSDDPLVNRIVRLLSIFCLKQAVYICAGKTSFEGFYHFGLAEQIYTHFTSPIRRYPDIIVHRMLAAAINSRSLIESLYSTDMIHRMSEHLNRRNISARIAGRESTKLFLYTYLKNLGREKIKETLGYVTRILNNAITVYVPEHHHLGFVRFDPQVLSKSGTIINLQSETIENKTNGLKLSLFEHITVKLSVDEKMFSSHSIQIQIISPSIPGL